MTIKQMTQRMKDKEKTILLKMKKNKEQEKKS